MYNLVMSYRYEFLMDVSGDFFNYTDAVDELRKLEAAPAKTEPRR